MQPTEAQQWEPCQGFSNLVAMLQFWSRVDPQKPLFKFLTDGEDQIEEISYGEMAGRARSIAVELQKRCLAGGRVILLYPPGLDYIAGLFGCLYSQVVAVPAYPPDPNRLERTLPRLQAIVKDSEAQAILSTEMICSLAEGLFGMAPELADLEWIATDRLPAEQGSRWQETYIAPQDLAFLQYTSGSTGEPKGVMLSHGNLIHNMSLIRGGFEIGVDFGVSWLPPYHDMGLIGGILEPIFAGQSSVLMSPLHFLQHPLRWLKAISKYRATISGGPNFAYQLCARKATAEQKAQLDLSSWTLAFNGAEPILPETIREFSETFAECGFRPEAFYSCYGLAEGTLMVSGGRRQAPLVQQEVAKDKFQQHQVTAPKSADDRLRLMGCGQSFPGQEIRIVHPESLTPCATHEVGEIWVRGKSVAQGYWKKPEATQATFGARLSEDSEGPYLRTGDLGFLQAGELFVTGRLKDLIIIRGQNHYPHDIERTMEACNPALRPGCSAAFSLEVDGEESLFLVQEVDLPAETTKADTFEEIFREIRRKVALHHELEPAAILFLKKGQIPKTSSGKIRRHATRDQFVAGTLPILKDSRAEAGQPKDSAQPPVPTAAPMPVNLDTANFEDIQNWLRQSVADHLGVDLQKIDPKLLFQEFGLDSKDAVNLSGELEDSFGRTFSPTLLWEHPSIERLAQYLSKTNLVKDPS